MPSYNPAHVISASDASSPRLGFREGILLLAGYTAISAILLWPWPSVMATRGIPAPDFIGNVWVLEQNLHNATTPGRHLSDSNAFWPHENTFAYNEALFSQTLQYGLFRLGGAPPLLAHNLTLFITFPLCGLGAALLAHELFQSRSGAGLAGMAFAFSSYRWDQFIHLQSLSLQWLPLTLWGLVRFERERRPATLGAVFVFAALLAGSSGYWAVVAAMAGGITLLHFLVRKKSRGAVLGSALALALAALLIFVLFTPYREAQAAWGMQRGAEVIHWSARLDSWLKPSDYTQWPHLLALRNLASQQKPLFAGTVPILLALVGVVSGWRRDGVRLTLEWFVVSFLVSLGPIIYFFGASFPGPYAILREVPVIGMLRTPSRLGVLALLSIATLSAAGFARIAGRRSRPLFVVLSALLLIEVYPRSLGQDLNREIQPAPATSTWLASAPSGPVLELPWTDIDMDAIYLYWSIPHWQPMVNGWASFEPGGSLGIGFIGNRWPTGYTSRVFRRVGIRYVVVHARDLGPDQRARLRPAELPEGVRLAADFGEDLVWEIDRKGRVVDEVPGWPKAFYSRASSGWDGIR
jgi:hypothetical protein